MKERKLEFDKNNCLISCSTGFVKDKDGNLGIWATNKNSDKYFIRKGESVENALIRYENNKNDEANILYGKEFKGYKGQEAINKLLEEKQGHIKNAFYRNDIGYIDLIWGNENLGLKHIIKRRLEDNIDPYEFLSNIAEIIEKGEYKGKNQNNNLEFWHKGKMVIIGIEYHNNKKTYLLSAFKRTKNKPSKTATV